MDNSKPSWRLRQMRGEVQRAIDEEPSLRAAAKRVGLNVSSISRGIQEGRLRAPGGPKVKRSAPAVDLAAPGTDPAGFAGRVRLKYELSDPEDQLLQLGQAALNLAHDAEQPAAVRLAAAREARAVLKDLKLPAEESYGALTSTGRYPRPA